MNSRGPWRSARPPKRLDSRNITTRRRQRRQPGLQGVVAGDLLEEEDEQEEDDAQAAVHRERLDVAGGEVARAGTAPSGSIGSRVRASRARNSAKTATPPIERDRAPAGEPQPTSGWRISANTGPGEAQRAEHRALPVDRAPRPVAGARAGTATRTSTSVASDERHVDEEDPAPRGGVDEPAADERPDDHRDARPRGPGPDRARRARRAGTSPTITASALGVSSAPNTPCSARAPTSTSIVGASAHSSDATPKPGDAEREDRAARRRCRRASRRSGSASRASAGRRSTTHCWPASPPPRSSLDRRQRDVHDRRVEARDERAHDRGRQREALAAGVRRTEGGGCGDGRTLPVAALGPGRSGDALLAGVDVHARRRGRTRRASSRGRAASVDRQRRRGADADEDRARRRPPPSGRARTRAAR